MDISSVRAAAIAVTAAFSLAVAPVGAAAASGPDRGALVSATPVTHLTVAQLDGILEQIPADTTHVRHDVSGYRLLYRTVDVHGRPTVASGLVVVPDGGPARLPTVVYGHGTQPYRAGVASVVAGNGDREVTELFAGSGFLAVAPDYLGLGTGPGDHPYMVASAEASASLDMLRAAAEFLASRGRGTDGSVRVTGFSQGGTAAMALGERLQDATGWRLAALAPISGPYDLEHVELPALIDHPGDGPGQLDPASGTFYIAYWLVSMNRLYHLYDSPAEAFKAPYDRFVTGLFDGYHDEETIAAALPGTPGDLLTGAYRGKLDHPTGPLRDAIRDNDRTCRWHPRVPVRLYAASGDRDAVIGNAVSCRSQLGAHGVNATLVDVGDVDHTGSVIRSIPLVLDWFLTVR